MNDASNHRDEDPRRAITRRDLKPMSAIRTRSPEQDRTRDRLRPAREFVLLDRSHDPRAESED